MTRTAFERQLTDIQDEMLALATMAETAIKRSVEALENGDVGLARQIIADDLKINEKRYNTEERCLELVATQQPLASDLRTIVAVLHIIVDLERIADHAEGNAKLTLLLADEPPVKPNVDIHQMAQKGIAMLHASLEAFKERDTERARAICEMDDEVDALYEHAYHELLTYMIQDPQAIQRATYLIWVAHNLERIADRVTNICERVVFMVTGRIQELNVSRY
jgi:phosphate transport system protein